MKKANANNTVNAAGCTYIPPEGVDVEEELFTSYRDLLVNGKVSTNTWLGKILEKDFKALATKDTNDSLNVIREVGKIANKTAEYWNRKKSIDSDFCKYIIREGLFPWQRNVYDCQNKKITMLCGRRSGKSYVIVDLAIKHCLVKEDKPREALILGLTLEKTAQLYWQNLKDAIDRAHIPISNIDNSNYTITLSNGNIIRLWGNNSKAEREKLRGKDTSFVAIDECQSQQALYYLIVDILGPIIKGRDGEIILAGTGPIYAGTYWETISTDDTWEHFHATMEDNPTIPNYEHALEEVLQSNNWTKDNITFRREYLGEVAYDTNRMIYPSRTYYDDKELENKHFIKCYIGADYGWQDSTSFMPIIVDDKGIGYLVEEWKENKVAASKIVEKMKELNNVIHKKYKIPAEDIYIIQDTSHQMIGVDFYNSGITNIQNAYKQEENAQIARVAEALHCGDLKIKKGGYFDMECDSFVWKWNQEKGCVIYEIDDNAFHPDAADSVKYAYNTYLSDNCVTI